VTGASTAQQSLAGIALFARGKTLCDRPNSSCKLPLVLIPPTEPI